MLGVWVINTSKKPHGHGFTCKVLLCHLFDVIFPASSLVFSSLAAPQETNSATFLVVRADLSYDDQFVGGNITFPKTSEIYHINFNPLIFHNFANCFCNLGGSALSGSINY